MRGTASALILLVPMFTSCTSQPGAFEKAASGLMECRKSFNTSFVAMSKTFDSVSTEKKLSLVLHAIQDREACDDKAGKAALAP